MSRRTSKRGQSATGSWTVLSAQASKSKKRSLQPRLVDGLTHHPHFGVRFGTFTTQPHAWNGRPSISFFTTIFSSQPLVTVAKADLILDETLFEIKTTRDARCHAEHVAQLLAYYLTSQSPVRKRDTLAINELAIYYARHGFFVKYPIFDLMRFPPRLLVKVAFDFLAEFEFWRICRTLSGLSATQTKALRDASFNETLKSVYPRPAWLLAVLELKSIPSPLIFLVRPKTRIRRINVPIGFLILH